MQAMRLCQMDRSEGGEGGVKILYQQYFAGMVEKHSYYNNNLIQNCWAFSDLTVNLITASSFSRISFFEMSKQCFVSPNKNFRIEFLCWLHVQSPFNLFCPQKCGKKCELIDFVDAFRHQIRIILETF